MGLSLAALVLLLGFAVSLLSGWLGIGGGIVMAPALLYLPPLVGVGVLDMREVTGLTITGAVFACLSGATRHQKYHHVNRRLVAWMGTSITLGALAGSIVSASIANHTLMLIFAALAILAAVLICLPRTECGAIDGASACAFNVPVAVSMALGVGLLGGMVGQGGSFLLIPLMLHILKRPTRVAIGSNLAIVLFASLAGFVGKLGTGQIALLPAACLVAGACPGAQLGSVLSQRTRPRWLRTALAVVIALAAVKIGTDVLTSF